MTLILVQGPAGGGKSQLAKALLASGEGQILADITALWAALSATERLPDGRYPVRLDTDPALALAQYLQAAAVRQGLEDGNDVIVTTSRADQVARWQEVADDADTGLTVRTVDPGRSVVADRLADAAGRLSGACARAISRWYGA